MTAEAVAAFFMWLRSFFAEFDTQKNKGAVDGLIYSGVEAIDEDGKLHIRVTTVKKGKVTIPFTVYGNKFTVVIIIK